MQMGFDERQSFRFAIGQPGLQFRQIRPACGRPAADRAGRCDRWRCGRAIASGQTSASTLLAHRARKRRIADQFFDGIEPLVDRRRIDQRRGDPIGQQPRSHRCASAVDHAQQRSVTRAAAKRARDFQTASGRGIDLQKAAAMMGGQGAKMIQVTALCFLQIGQHGAGGANRRCVVVVETESFQIVNGEMFAERFPGGVFGERPGGSGSPDQGAVVSGLKCASSSR